MEVSTIPRFETSVQNPALSSCVLRSFTWRVLAGMDFSLPFLAHAHESVRMWEFLSVLSYSVVCVSQL